MQNINAYYFQSRSTKSVFQILIFQFPIKGNIVPNKLLIKRRTINCTAIEGSYGLKYYLCSGLLKNLSLAKSLMKNSEHPVAVFVVRIGLRVGERVMTLKKVKNTKKINMPLYDSFRYQDYGKGCYSISMEITYPLQLILNKKIKIVSKSNFIVTLQLIKRLICKFWYIFTLAFNANAPMAIQCNLKKIKQTLMVNYYCMCKIVLKLSSHMKM